MWESYLEWRDDWPAVDAPEDLYSYFVSEQLTKYPDSKIYIYSRETFLKALEKNPNFREFWIQVQEKQPEKSEYFASLMEEHTPYKCNWLMQEYYRYLFKNEFKEILEAEQKELQSEFDKIRPNAYQAALRGEAVRLNCDVFEVRPLHRVLPLAPDGNEESKLKGLPDAIFLNIISRLDTLDVFRVTLVCRSWKNIICNNPRDLKRAEHAKTTHLITFTDWMDPTRTPSRQMFENSYCRFSCGLIRWCYGITQYLETIILDHPISYVDVATLMQSCPNLKNLQIGNDKTIDCIRGDGSFNSDVLLPRLEFYCSRMSNGDDESEVDMKILISCESLRYFGGIMVFYEIPTIEIQDRMKYALGNLVALDLVEFTFVMLEILADVDDLPLKYLGIGDLFPYYLLSDDAVETARFRDFLERILPKLKRLEILKLNGDPGIGSSTIKLLTKLKLNLKFAVFLESLTYSRCTIDDNPNEMDCWEAQVLTDFGQMLLSNNSGLDMSEFYFIVTEREVPHDLREVDCGFTIISVTDCKTKEGLDVGLNFRTIKKRLGIDF